MRPELSVTSLSRVAGVGFLLGLFGTALWSADDLRPGSPTLEELQQLTHLEPVQVLPRTGLLLVSAEARLHLTAGRPWAAWRLIMERMDDPSVAPASVVVLAARSAVEWGGWSEARELLLALPALTEVDGGEGLFLLGRAEEELGNHARAAAAYRRYLSLPGAASRALAQARLGKVLREGGDPRGSAAALAEAAPGLSGIEDWISVARLEQLAHAYDPSVAELATRGVGGSSPVRLRRVLAEVEGWEKRGDLSRAIQRLDWEARVLRAQGASAESARLQIERARLLMRTGGEAGARDLLRATAFETSVPSALRLTAAEALGELENRTAPEELARSAAFEAAAKPGLAAKALRAALSAGAPDDAGVRLRLAHLLYDARDYGPARAAFRVAAEHLQEREPKAEAELFAARALYRTGSRGKAGALAEFREVAQRHEGTPAAGTALFLLGDEAASLAGALSYYRRASEVRGSPDAREALFRVGDRRLKLDDPAGALKAWEEYVGRYPRGEETARVAYEVGKIHERAGREGRAREMYAAAIQADPISYYSLRAANRLGVDPLEGVLAEPRPWVGLAADPQDASDVLARLDALERIGFDDERDEEMAAAIRAFETRPLALLVLAEGLRDRGEPVQAIRLGRRLLDQRDGQWDERLLRVVFPFPFRDLVEAEAERADVDPMLFAGLIRQESNFRADARSWVGATGLGQIMPATGRWLAPSVGVRSYDDRLLEVPEVNLRMGARYLGDLLDRYDGARDLALSGYNAGPSRADRWRRELGHGRDTDAFREAIPFDETRHYVKVVLRNAAIYERLYGADWTGGLVRTDE